MATYDDRCRRCGHAVTLHVGQRHARSRLWWHQAYHCAHCGNQEELDSDGPLPASFRAAILRQEGAWRLTLAATQTDSLRPLMILRQALQLDLAEIRDRKCQLLGPGIVGTHGEVAWLQALLYADGITANIERIDPAIGPAADPDGG